MTGIGGVYAQGGYPEAQGLSDAEKLGKCGWVLMGVGMALATISALVVVGVAACIETANKGSRLYLAFLYFVGAVLIFTLIRVMQEVYKGFSSRNEKSAAEVLLEGRTVPGEGYDSSFEYKVVQDGEIAARGIINIKGEIGKDDKGEGHSEDCVSCMPNSVEGLVPSVRQGLASVSFESANDVAAVSPVSKRSSQQEARNDEKSAGAGHSQYVVERATEDYEVASSSRAKVVYSIDSRKIDYKQVRDIRRIFQDKNVFVTSMGSGKDLRVVLKVGDKVIEQPHFSIDVVGAGEVVTNFAHEMNFICNVNLPAGCELRGNSTLLAVAKENRGTPSSELRGEIFYKVSVPTHYDNMVRMMFSYENIKNEVWGEMLFTRYLLSYYRCFKENNLVYEDANSGEICVDDGFLMSPVGRQFACDIVNNRDNFSRGVNMYGNSSLYMVRLSKFLSKVEEKIPEKMRFFFGSVRQISDKSIAGMYDTMRSIYALTCGIESGYFVAPSLANEHKLYKEFFTNRYVRVSSIAQAIKYGQQSYFMNCIRGFKESIDALIRLFRNAESPDEIKNMYLCGSDIEKAVVCTVAQGCLNFSNTVDEMLSNVDHAYYSGLSKQACEKNLALVRRLGLAGDIETSGNEEKLRDANNRLAALVPYSVADSFMRFADIDVLTEITGKHVGDPSVPVAPVLRNLCNRGAIDGIVGRRGSSLSGLFSQAMKKSVDAYVTPLSETFYSVAVSMTRAASPDSGSHAEGGNVDQSDQDASGVVGVLQDVSVESQSGVMSAAGAMRL